MVFRCLNNSGLYWRWLLWLPVSSLRKESAGDGSYLQVHQAAQRTWSQPLSTATDCKRNIISCSLLRLMAPVREKRLQVGPKMLGTYTRPAVCLQWDCFIYFFPQPSFTSVLLRRYRLFLALTRYFSEQWQSFHFPPAALGYYSFSLNLLAL